MRPLVPLIALAAAACTGGAPAGAHIRVDTSATFQAMTGWEVTSQAGHAEASYARYRDTLMALAAGDLGLNRLRLEVRSGSEHRRDYWAEGRARRLTGDDYRCARYETVNDNDDPRSIDWSGFHFTELDNTVEQLVRPLQAALAARGARLSISVMYVAFFRQCPHGRRYDHRDTAEYAEFALAVMEHLREKYRIEPDAWEVILEPDNTDDWSGRRVGEAVVATAARFRERGIRATFVAPSNTSLAGAVRDYDALAAVPGARALVSELSYHRYKDVSHDGLRALDERRRGGVRTAMLEHIGSGVDDLLDDLTIANVSAWQQYALTFPGTPDRGGLYYLVDTTNADHPVVREARRTPFLRQVFRAATPGAVRLGATSDARAARPVAFRNPGGGIGVAVRTSRAAALTITGLPAGRYAVSFATGAEPRGTLPDAEAADGTLRAAIPAAGVLTVLAR